MVETTEDNSQMDNRKTLEDLGCIREGHFVGVSGKHLAGYCNIDPLLPHVSIVDEMIEQLVNKFKDDDIDTVASLAVGAIPFSHTGARFVANLTGKDIRGVWADKSDNEGEKRFDFDREGFEEAVRGNKVLILEDMINQMVSIKAMVHAVKKAGGEIVGVGSIAANKGVSAEAIGVPKFVNLCDVQYDVWTPEDCTEQGLCSKSVPIVEDIGHGDSYKKNHPEYSGGYIKLLI